MRAVMASSGGSITRQIARESRNVTVTNRRRRAMMRARDQVVGTPTDRTDEELLASHETDDFGVFYDRHVRALLGYFQRRTGDPQVAADLTAETFASAIVAQERYVPTGAPALAWLYRIAVATAGRLPAARARSSARCSARSPWSARAMSEEDADMIRLLADDAALTHARRSCRADQRDAVTGTRRRRARATRSWPPRWTPRRPRCASASRAGWRRCAGGWEGSA